MSEPSIDGVAIKAQRPAIRLLSALAVTAALVMSGFALNTAASTHRAGAVTIRPHAIDAYIIFSANATGITGEGGTGGPGNIEVSSFSWGETMPVTTTGLATGRIKYNPFSITRKVDKASPILWRTCSLGTRIKVLTMYMTPPLGAASTDKMIITFTNVLISSVSWIGNGGGQQPMESVSFIPASYQIQYVSGPPAG